MFLNIVKIILKKPKDETKHLVCKFCGEKEGDPSKKRRKMGRVIPS
jgi:hypothetical protein